MYGWVLCRTPLHPTRTIHIWLLCPWSGCMDNSRPGAFVRFTRYSFLQPADLALSAWCIWLFVPVTLWTIQQNAPIYLTDAKLLCRTIFFFHKSLYMDSVSNFLHLSKCIWPLVPECAHVLSRVASHFVTRSFRHNLWPFCHSQFVTPELPNQRCLGCPSLYYYHDYTMGQ